MRMHLQCPCITDTLVRASIFALVYVAIENAYVLGMHAACDIRDSRGKPPRLYRMSKMNVGCQHLVCGLQRQHELDIVHCQYQDSGVRCQHQVSAISCHSHGSGDAVAGSQVSYILCNTRALM